MKKIKSAIPRRKWCLLKGPIFAVFDDRGRPWMCSISKTKTGASDQWLRDGRFRGRYAHWVYWEKAGYSVRQIKLQMLVQ